MTDTWTSLLKIAWKVALTLTAIKCAHYVVRRVSSSRLRLSQYGSVLGRHVQLRLEVDEARRTVQGLRERLQQESESAQLREELLHQEAGFWRRMEHLARKEIGRKDEEYRRAEVRIEAQSERLLVLEARLRDAMFLAQEQERVFAEERASMQALLAVAQEDLSTAQDSFAPEDKTADVDVVQLVRSLNLDISKTATLLTESFHVEDHRRGDGFVEAYERTKVAVGPIMAELLESIHHEDDPILVHIALQADMISFAAGIISAWDFQHQSNATFSGIYKQMLKSESQKAVGRWRALTRQYSKQRLYNGRDLTAGFTNQLAERLADIMFISGARVDHERLRQSVNASLESIIRSALNLQQVIGEQVLSRDLEIMTVRVDDLFDPEQMEDVYGDEEPTADDHEPLHVLCTASLGLRRCDKPKGGLGDELQVTTLVRPKVVLETLVYELGLVEEEEMSPQSSENTDV
ncbi:uncharacterized protein FIBRA_06817 [Fibroporia radiculosa]|uniref:Uncharacterized protein n=1 Tax=Fibroporia radiculosa TaxID=599839 RepID=J4GCK9_9APHY|nr:uncharacterized protein FIBRA_06817 [Fibroporia radiculosa]CCM04633.1 predicted protein [Fibroporia radiculosa]